MYVRKTLRVEDPGLVGVVERMVSGLRPYNRCWGRGSERDDFEPVVLFFCGRPVVMYRTAVHDVKSEWSHAAAEWVQKKTLAWTYYDTMDALDEASDMGNWFKRDIHTAWSRLLGVDGTHVHHATNVPVLAVYPYARGARGPLVEVDPRLKDLSFNRLVGADRCYQEIDQFVGGVLSNNPTIVQVSDRDRLLAHGFDPKWSFRNPLPLGRKRGKRGKRGKG